VKSSYREESSFRELSTAVGNIGVFQLMRGRTLAASQNILGGRCNPTSLPCGLIGIRRMGSGFVKGLVGWGWKMWMDVTGLRTFWL